MSDTAARDEGTVGAEGSARGASDDRAILPRKGRARRRLIFDGAVLAVYAVSANPAVTGVPVHEWTALGALMLLGAHCAARGMLRGASAKGVALTALNVLLLGCVALCAVSGIMVSGTVLPTLGLYAEGYYFWDPLHAVSAKMLLALLLVHGAVHIPWILGALRR